MNAFKILKKIQETQCIQSIKTITCIWAQSELSGHIKTVIVHYLKIGFKKIIENVTKDIIVVGMLR